MPGGCPVTVAPDTWSSWRWPPASPGSLPPSDSSQGCSQAQAGTVSNVLQGRQGGRRKGEGQGADRLLPALSRPPLLPPGGLAQPCPRVHAPGPRGRVCGPGQLGGVGVVTGHRVPRCPTHLASHPEACLARAGVVLRLRRGLVPRAVGRGENVGDQPGGERFDSCTSPVRLDHLQVLSAGPWPHLASA